MSNPTTTHPPPSQPIHHVKTSELQTSGGQTAGMIRQNAIVDKCDGICALRMLANPHTSSAVHHHGGQDTVLYAVRGRGAVLSEGGKKRVEVEPGDYVLIPAYMEHQEVNDYDEECLWTVVRTGRSPETVNLKGWGGEVDDS